MKEICSKIEINAPSKIVWDILINFEDFSRWNPFIQKISGDIYLGSTIEVYIKPPDSMGMNFKPKIIRCEDEKTISWLGKLWFSGIFDGEHSLIIEEVNKNSVQFIQKEKFTGILVPFLSGTLKNTETGFELMNKALKMESERKFSEN